MRSTNSRTVHIATRCRSIYSGTCSRKIEGTAEAFDREVNSWNQNCNHTLDLFTVTNSMMVHEIDWYDNIKN